MQLVPVLLNMLTPTGCCLFTPCWTTLQEEAIRHWALTLGYRMDLAAARR